MRGILGIEATVILDANVFVSGLFFAGPPYRILKAWQDGKVKLIVSQEIIEEYQRVRVAGFSLQPFFAWRGFF
jgi:predicted nucleic acid-binding protein